MRSSAIVVRVGGLLAVEIAPATGQVQQFDDGVRDTYRPVTPVRPDVRTAGRGLPRGSACGLARRPTRTLLP